MGRRKAMPASLSAAATTTFAEARRARDLIDNGELLERPPIGEKPGKRTKKVKESEWVIRPERISLGELLSEVPPSQEFDLWLIGDTPLLCHAWSEKAKQQMLKKQAGATRTAKEKRDPDEDFINSLYEIGKDSGIYGFPVTAVKSAILSCAHKDRGIPRTDVQAGLWLDAEMVKVKTAHPGAKCNLPLVRIYGKPPEMREDMVRIGSGAKKTANLAYRGEFTGWALHISGSVNPLMVPPHALAFLVRQAGVGIGIGDWRNEKNGWFGAFHLAGEEERKPWDSFKKGTGPLPKVTMRGAPPPEAPATGNGRKKRGTR